MRKRCGWRRRKEHVAILISSTTRVSWSNVWSSWFIPYCRCTARKGGSLLFPPEPVPHRFGRREQKPPHKNQEDDSRRNGSPESPVRRLTPLTGRRHVIHPASFLLRPRSVLKNVMCLRVCYRFGRLKLGSSTVVSFVWEQNVTVLCCTVSRVRLSDKQQCTSVA